MKTILTKCQFCAKTYSTPQGAKKHETSFCIKNPAHKKFVGDIEQKTIDDKKQQEEYIQKQEKEPIKPTTIEQPITQISPPLPPTRRDKEIALKETEIAFIKDFAGGRHQNTTISHDERILLAVLHHDLAKNPWSVSRRICEDRGIPFNPKEFEIDFLEDFIRDYLDFGLPLDRQGRGEVKEIFTAYFRGDKDEDKKEKEKLIP